MIEYTQSHTHIHHPTIDMTLTHTITPNIEYTQPNPNIQALDSFGRIAHYAGVFSATECEAVYSEGFELFGVLGSLISFMSDCSTAALRLAAKIMKDHALCFQHFRQHLWDAVATFSFSDKNEFWQLAMKVLKWRGYASDAALMVDITALQQRFARRNSRVAQVLGDLVKHRKALCAHHVSQIFTMMRIASAVAESTHSA